MVTTRKVEVFTAGCPLCDEAVALVQDLACPSCEVVVHDMRKDGAARAEAFGVTRLPAVVVDGELAACCRQSGVTRDGLLASGVGTPIP